MTDELSQINLILRDFQGLSLHYEKFADGSMKCIEDEIPFELSEGWVWCRVRDIALVKGVKRLPKGTSFSEKYRSCIHHGN